MSEIPGAEFVDHYAVLAVEYDADRDTIRKAFRKRLLEAHPDKAAEPADGAVLARVMRAWEILGDADLRDAYDRVWKLQNRDDWLDGETAIPHVTESDKPQNRARSILFLLLEGRGPEALERLRALGEAAPLFLRKYLDSDEFIDASFLIAELFEARNSWFEALEWLDQLIRAERGRRRHRPCYNEALDRTRRLLIRRTGEDLEPRVALEYLRRAEALGLDRPQRVEVERRRAQCYLDMGMRVEAAKHLENALELQPSGKGLTRLLRELADLVSVEGVAGGAPGSFGVEGDEVDGREVSSPDEGGPEEDSAPGWVAE